MFKNKNIETSYSNIKENKEKFKLNSSISKVFEPYSDSEVVADDFILDIDEDDPIDQDRSEFQITQQIKAFPQKPKEEVFEEKSKELDSILMKLDKNDKSEFNSKIAIEMQEIINSSKPITQKRTLDEELASYSKIKETKDDNKKQLAEQVLTSVRLLDLMDQIKEELPKDSKLVNKIQSISNTLKIDNKNLGQTILLFCRELKETTQLDLPWNNPILLISKLVRSHTEQKKEIERLKSTIRNLLDQK